MPATSRASLVRGPSKNTYNGGVCFSKEDFEIKIIKDTLPITTSPTGKADERVIEVQVEASITPDGRWTNAVLGAFINPVANMVPGASLLTGSDLPFVASASDGQIHTINAAAVTKLPDIFLSAKKTMFGSLTVRGYRSLATGWLDANSLYTLATSGGSLTDTTWVPQNIVVQPYSATWGAISGFTSFDTQDGWTISFNMETEEIETDSTGKIDVAFKSLEVMAKCVPVGPTATQILTAAKIQGLSGSSGMARGYSLHNDGSGSVTPDLVITGQDGASIVTLAAANIKTAGYQFGATKLRNGEVGFVSTRKYTTGAQQPLFVLAAAS